MKNGETREYELVVGNRQVVSAFFIVVLLLAAAFALGYVIGRNAPRSNAQSESLTPANPAAQAANTQAQPLGAAAPAASPDASAQPPADSAEKPADTEPPPQPTTQPAREAPQPPPAVAQAPGSYWQVGAFKQSSEAQPILQTLRDGGMPTLLRPESDGFVHVLVGPYRDAASLSAARATLESKFGIKEMVRK